ncbi:tankyrase-2-like [Trichogramma pretiosum]|uniref:tankyrase-2-like n=1 Tax=Trichogramma pretiosum TaxID=7493 RepID=UPI0006C99686|nr:tankyrase-2-like [Trichogramma pretiosum]
MHKAYTKAEKKEEEEEEEDANFFHCRGKVESLLFDSIYYMDDEASCARGGRFIEFVALSGYKADLDQAGKPVSRYTTPLHVAAKYEYHQLIDHLFRVYDAADANRSDESGLTHFHVACRFGRKDIVRKHLDLGLDSNLRVRETGDSPQHLALANHENETAASLLRNGATRIWPTASDTPVGAGRRPGHVGQHAAAPGLGSGTLLEDDGDSLQLLFDVCDEKRRPVRVDAWDKNGNTALHLALLRENKNVVSVLLRRGADPFVANEVVVIPLHFMYRSHDYDVEEMFYKLDSSSSSSSNDEYESVGSKIRETTTPRTRHEIAVVRID